MDTSAVQPVDIPVMLSSSVPEIVPIKVDAADSKGDLTRRIFKAAKSGIWNTLIDEFIKDNSTLKKKITSSDETALHILVIEGYKKEVQRLIQELPDGKDKEEIMLMKNNRGDTPLHLAAFQGDWDLCGLLLGEGESFVQKAFGARNEDLETPLFLAALHGKRDAFFVLYHKLQEKLKEEQSISEYDRRNDGNTILHVAIMGEHFDLAFQIIHIYRKEQAKGTKGLANRINEKGESPLHILAKCSHSFRSGYHLGMVDNIIYHLAWADPLKHSNIHPPKPVKEGGKSNLPENYSTCILMFKLALRPVGDVVNYDAWKKWLKTRLDRGQKSKGNNNADPEKQSGGKAKGPKKEEKKNRTTHFAYHQKIPQNYVPLFRLLEYVLMISLTILGLGFWKMKKLKDRKQRHTWAIQVMDELVEDASAWEYNADGKRPEGPLATPESFPSSLQDSMGKDGSGEQKNEVKEPEASNEGHDLKLTIRGKKNHLEIIVNPDGLQLGGPQSNLDELKSETPILVAAMTGAKEIVAKILDIFPVAIRDVSKDGKNIVLLAVEHRQPFVFQFLTDLCLKKSQFESDFQKVDNDGNSALHLAATLGKNRPWIIPGAALQMQWEIKWYKLVKSSMQSHSFVRVNKKGQTAKEIFTETHRELVREGGDWLINTSQSCSVVAALIATVAFAAAVTVPGGNKDDQGTPNLEGRPAFDMFAISSLMALCLSVTSLIMFLAILTSRHVAKDFEWSLPRKLILGLTSLFFSIAAILLSFCAAHYFLLRNHLKQLVIYVYAVPCLPVALFAFAQFPLFFDLIKAVLTRVPHRTYRETVY
ncbi:uncharacterized protein [Aristolochia californica]|uniref:uncharacterized protein n=1 Tax=Aristolochia californica TaxID=171875 RepID=UPI0035D5CC10